MKFDIDNSFIGGFSDNDGTIDFYLRVNSLISKGHTILDLGAGRAAWFEDDKCDTRRNLRLLKGKVKKVIACDVDKIVFENRASDEQIHMANGELGIRKNSIDLILADYVLEHISDPKMFFNQLDQCLKEGGFFCARTPLKYSYVSLAASLVKNSRHAKLLSYVQPTRKEVDVFPTAYKMNTMRNINKSFQGWHNMSFIFRPDPGYYFGNKALYKLQSLMHRVMPKWLCGNLFVFVQKPYKPNSNED